MPETALDLEAAAAPPLLVYVAKRQQKKSYHQPKKKTCQRRAFVFRPPNFEAPMERFLSFI
jgi:hypothetical protein